MTELIANEMANEQVKKHIKDKKFLVIFGSRFSDGTDEFFSGVLGYDAIVKLAKQDLDKTGWGLIDRFRMNLSAETVFKHSVEVLNRDIYSYTVYDIEDEYAVDQFFVDAEEYPIHEDYINYCRSEISPELLSGIRI